MSENRHNDEHAMRQTKQSQHYSKYQRRRKPDSQRPLANLDDMENIKLEQAVRELNCFEALDRGTGSSDRATAVEYLENLIARWCTQVEESKLSQVPNNNNTAPSFAAIAGKGTSPKSNVWQRAPPSVIGTSSTKKKTNTVAAALIPFGSYRLGVHSTDSDLDLLALAPPSIRRSDFFTTLVKMLQDDANCHQIHPIASAYTPVIKFVLNIDRELHIDLVFARVANVSKLLEYHAEKARRKLRGLTHEYRLDDTDLQDLDEAGVRSLNGARVTQMILEAIPDVHKFQTVLRAVKQWAVAQGIYSNKLGFLGGVNWALLVAWVCKKFPKMSASNSLRQFFSVFAKWDWNTPVLLNGSIAETPPVTNVSTGATALKLPAWNPYRNPRDGFHVMPIITPAYPSMNSSFNVGQPQLRRMIAELMRAHNLLNFSKKPKDNVYKKLFAPTDFFESHTHFLHLKIVAGDEQDFVEWFRFVESKMRILINNIDTREVRAWPLARFFSEPKDGLPNNVEGGPANEFSSETFIGLQFGPEVDETILEHLTKDFLTMVDSWECRNDTMDLLLAPIRDEHVPWYVWKAIKPNSAEVVKGGSVGTAPATDDDDSCETPKKKCRVLNITGARKVADNLELL